MSVVAKRYAKAIASRDDVDEFYKNLSVLASAFAHPKFKILIQTREISREKKLELLKSMLEKPHPKFNNLLRILLENSRLPCIPQIVAELEKQRFFRDNVFLGVAYSGQALDALSLKNLEEKLGAKFNVQIKLSNQVAPIAGIKITLEELGYEVSFFMKTFQNRLSEFILKTI